MKKIFLVLVSGIIIASCNEADKTANSANATSTDETVTKSDDVAKLNETSNVANNPSSSTSQTPADTTNQTTIEWLDGADRDFGKMKEGENLDVSFRFKNTGTKPLIISNVTAGCGCTVPETPKKPYAPGETGVIKAAFNSTGKPGTQSKQVYVTANVNPPTTTLLFRVEVKPKSK